MYRRLLIHLSFFAGVICVILTLALISSTPAGAVTTERFVSTQGRDSIPSGSFFIINDCSVNTDPCRTIQHAINWANVNDEIYIAGGVYTSSGASVITVTKTVSLFGGWDGSNETPPRLNPAINKTVLDGQLSRRVVKVHTGTSPTISGVVIANGGGAATNEGGGILSEASHLDVSNCVITNNHAINYGGGIYISENATLLANEIVSNSATYGGGGVGIGNSAHVILEGNRIAENQSSYGGGIEVDHAVVTATKNLIIQNTSNSAWMISGNNAQVNGENNVLLRNSEVAVKVYSSQVNLTHTTIVSNTGNAINLQYNAVLSLNNSLIAFNGNGIYYAGGCTVNGSNNLFWNNHTNTFSGTNFIVGNPLLAMDGYHLTSDSPAIDAGLNAAVLEDIDGDKRPILSGFDIGADEWMINVFLPLILKNFP